MFWINTLKPEHNWNFSSSKSIPEFRSLCFSLTNRITAPGERELCSNLYYAVYVHCKAPNDCLTFPLPHWKHRKAARWPTQKATNKASYCSSVLCKIYSLNSGNASNKPSGSDVWTPLQICRSLLIILFTCVYIRSFRKPDTEEWEDLTVIE